MKDFFISYNRADKSWAEWIAWQLEEAGYTTVLQAWDFGTGSNFVLEMQKAAAEADRTIAVLSPDYLTSHFTAPEWAAAFAQDPTGSGRKLVPIRVRECDPAGLLDPIVYENLVGLDERAAKAALYTAVKRGRAKPGAAPAFPPAAGRAVASQPRFPRSLPPIWNVPHLRNPNFTGREDLLNQLRESLTSGERAALTQAMHGLGGIGKTQIAIEYAYRYSSEYEALLWVPAEDPVALAGRFAGLANELRLDVDPADHPAAIATVLRWLCDNARWLLIFDNAEDVTSIRPYLPQAGTGHIIITSRNPGWRRIGTPVEVPYFTIEEGAHFLLNRVGSSPKEQAESSAAATLALQLGGLAIALEQAAAYVDTHGMSLSTYLRLFDKYREEVLSREESPDYSHTLETVWAISLKAVRNSSPAAGELLELLAFFAPDDIPIYLICAGADAYPDALAKAARDELDLQDAIRILRRHSLVEVDDGGIFVHRIVQLVVRRSLSPTQRYDWTKAAIEAVSAVLPKNPEDVDTWPAFARLAAHAIASAEHSEREEAYFANAASCLFHTGKYLQQRADFPSAQKLFELALQITETTLGPSSTSAALIANSIGTVLHEVGDLEGAKLHYERALVGYEMAFGKDHQHVGAVVANLGSLYGRMGDFGAAQSACERALGIQQTSFGPADRRVAATLTLWGNVLTALGDLVRARELCERALSIMQMSPSTNQLDLALSMHSLAHIYYAEGSYAEAWLHWSRAMTILTNTVGDEHPNAQLVKGLLERCVQRLGSDHPSE